MKLTVILLLLVTIFGHNSSASCARYILNFKDLNDSINQRLKEYLPKVPNVKIEKVHWGEAKQALEGRDLSELQELKKTFITYKEESKYRGNEDFDYPRFKKLEKKIWDLVGLYLKANGINFFEIHLMDGFSEFYLYPFGPHPANQRALEYYQQKNKMLVSITLEKMMSQFIEFSNVYQSPWNDVSGLEIDFDQLAHLIQMDMSKYHQRPTEELRSYYKSLLDKKVVVNFRFGDDEFVKSALSQLGFTEGPVWLKVVRPDFKGYGFANDDFKKILASAHIHALTNEYEYGFAGIEVAGQWYFVDEVFTDSISSMIFNEKYVEAYEKLIRKYVKNPDQTPIKLLTFHTHPGISPFNRADLTATYNLMLYLKEKFGLKIEEHYRGVITTTINNLQDEIGFIVDDH